MVTTVNDGIKTAVEETIEDSALRTEKVIECCRTYPDISSKLMHREVRAAFFENQALHSVEYFLSALFLWKSSKHPVPRFPEHASSAAR